MSDNYGEMTYEEAVQDAKTRIREVTPGDARDLRSRDASVVYLDVREPHEWNLFHIPGAVHIPLGTVLESVSDSVGRDKQIVVYCARGNRSAIAADRMQKMGYSNVVSMSAGIRGWVDAGGDVET